MFRNLYLFDQAFRDHNWNDFFDDLRQDKESYIEAQLEMSYEEGGPEPYFERIFPVTLNQESCASFMRSTSLPITDRDYYLSKLHQFLYVPLQFAANFDPTFTREDHEAMPERLARFLNGIPPACIERLSKFDWDQFHYDTVRCPLNEVLSGLHLYLPDLKQLQSPDKMTKERWIGENWPERLRQARGADPQKVAAERFHASTDAYKKWEEGARPPAPRYMTIIRKVIGDLESKTTALHVTPDHSISVGA